MDLTEFFKYIYMYKHKTQEWVHLTYYCLFCQGRVGKQNPINHLKRCKIINTSEENKMPIQTVMIKGMKFYRWGDNGKLYRDRTQAEQQARAAYSLGYKESNKDMKK